MLVCVCLVACAAEDCKDASGIARVHVSPLFPSDEQDHIQNALNRWNAFAGHTVVTGAREEYGVTCNILNASNPIAPNIQGRFQHATGNISIGPVFRCSGVARDGMCLEALVLHEVGHMLGFDHHPPGVAGVMQNPGVTLDFTDADLLACLAAGVCVGDE